MFCFYIISLSLRLVSSSCTKLSFLFSLVLVYKTIVHFYTIPLIISFTHSSQNSSSSQQRFSLPKFIIVVVVVFDNKRRNRKIFLLLTSNSRADVAVGRLWSFSVCFSTQDSSTTMLVWRFFINPMACSTLRSLTMINNLSVKRKGQRSIFYLTFQLIAHKCCSTECSDVQRWCGDVSSHLELSSEPPCDPIGQPGHSSYPFSVVAE